ncbi:GspH/FimT family pseudopilin [Pseudomonas guariconensis]|uniref:GspH/FimT family pseudopilin n=1 Tax=Pseudomonas TaxID=286 RepID=UPI001CE482F3|nr:MULTISPECIES: GspH/FimT family pseudopilin [Pseudomonas]MCO7642789.1 GspH/FimT family pseudopilin [Pseudomonas sp. S 311-6]MCO7513795.1 GspH/FimT family pseudopilin [Pseudomonas putida]MCO7567539.1 GspH/FimT family pseudopilin [Pseudomonas mosselii]MCO7595389.1 GspH/FimT family pseudopilin [Pseudomonas guariconensis]MCO7603804.1 GspH/FimT family pseudopilin [Pseudomonas guariconensis]
MKQQGVTLIQTLCALALVSLLTQVGIPAYNHLSEGLHQAAAARELAHALRNARGHALLRQQTVLVRALQNDWGIGWRTLLAHDGQLLHERRLGRRLKVVGNLGNEVKFSGLGVPLRGNGAFLGGTFEICQGTTQASHLQVVLAPSGRISLRTGTADPPLCAGR